MNSKKATISNIPDGFTTSTGSDGKPYLVPQYMVLALDHAFDSYHKKLELSVIDASAAVS